jgi:hypothetical protein
MKQLENFKGHLFQSTKVRDTWVCLPCGLTAIQTPDGTDFYPKAITISHEISLENSDLAPPCEQAQQS